MWQLKQDDSKLKQRTTQTATISQRHMQIFNNQFELNALENVFQSRKQSNMISMLSVAVRELHENNLVALNYDEVDTETVEDM